MIRPTRRTPVAIFNCRAEFIDAMRITRTPRVAE